MINYLKKIISIIKVFDILIKKNKFPKFITTGRPPFKIIIKLPTKILQNLETVLLNNISQLQNVK